MSAVHFAFQKSQQSLILFKLQGFLKTRFEVKINPFLMALKTKDNLRFNIILP